MAPDDDALPPPARRLCDAMAAAFPDPAVAPLDASALRRAAAGGVAPRGGRASRPPDAVRVHEVEGGPVPMRAYDPGGGADRPFLVFLHGGGWVLSGLATHDRLCHELARRTGALVLAVDHRAAPEHRFPAAVDDAVAALTWALAQAERLGCDPGRVLLVGDSSGGNLAAATALAVRGNAPGPAGVVLVYPVLDALPDTPATAGPP
ncbi:alpha/beta hydrolase fold domain-containing protein, partial [Streptacidiphilus anmyonensis]|uniref:alpha/beta hydrolase fold domain-containing protein n=1 Tax=Streptacidiphilus anmyonensis TaxID=405782 RepID=UPI00272CB335